jgi:Domain of unknown function (DUF4286)
MLRYTVTVTLPDSATAKRFVVWLRDSHIAEVIAGGATSAEVFRLDGAAISYEIAYCFPSRTAFAAYERDYAPRLREEGRMLFPPSNGIIYQRGVAELVAKFPEVT